MPMKNPPRRNAVSDSLCDGGMVSTDTISTLIHPICASCIFAATPAFDPEDKWFD